MSDQESDDDQRRDELLLRLLKMPPKSRAELADELRRAKAKKPTRSHRSKIPRFFNDASMPTETEADPTDPLFSSSAFPQPHEGDPVRSNPQTARPQQHPPAEGRQLQRRNSRKKR